MATKTKKLIGRFAARSLEEYAFALDLVRIPPLRKQQEKLIYDSYRLSNDIRRLIGDEPKKFKRLKSRDTIEVIAI